MTAQEKKDGAIEFLEMTLAALKTDDTVVDYCVASAEIVINGVKDGWLNKELTGRRTLTVIWNQPPNKAESLTREMF